MFADTAHASGLVGEPAGRASAFACFFRWYLLRVHVVGAGRAPVSLLLWEAYMQVIHIKRALDCSCSPIVCVGDCMYDNKIK